MSITVTCLSKYLFQYWFIFNFICVKGCEVFCGNFSPKAESYIKILRTVFLQTNFSNYLMFFFRDQNLKISCWVAID